VPFLVSIFFLLFIFFFIIYFWGKNKFFKKILKNHHIHDEHVPRIGGAIIFLYLLFFSFLGNSYLNNMYIHLILLSFIPIFLISLKEDLFHDTKPSHRIFSMMLSVLIFLLFFDESFPIIDISFLSNLMQFEIIKFTFFGICLIVLMNGMNLIDGANGLLIIVSIFQSIGLLVISFLMNDTVFIKLILLTLIPMTILFCFNFPSGVIFSGDLGAYFFGWLNGIYAIFLFGRYDELLSWLAVLIFFYPTMEIGFTMFRRCLLEKKIFFHPDQKHLHTLIFKLNQKFFIDRKISNNFVTLSLFLFWLPMPFIFLVYDSIFLVLMSLFLLFIIYVVLYLYLKKKDYS